MAEKMQGVMEVKELERLLTGTKQFKYVNPVDKIITEKISNNEGIEIPTTLYIARLVKEYYQEMLNLYNGTFGLFDAVTKIPDDIKVLQASVLDSFCYGYDVNTNSSSMYTLNFELFGYEQGVNEKLLAKVIEENTYGRIKAYRFDYSYTPIDENTIDWKLVNHRKEIDDENIILVPYLVGVRFLAIIRQFLSKGFVLMVKQLYEGNQSEKIRCITEVQDILKKFCDVPETVENLKSGYYPLDGYFYAPSIGSPSTTAMVTNIDIFRVTEIKRVSSVSELKSLGIQKASNPIQNELVDNAIAKYMSYLSRNTSNDYINFIQNLPKNELLGIPEIDAKEGAFYSYLHSLKGKEKEEVFKKLPKERRDKVKEESKLYTGIRQATPEEMSNLSELFKNKLCKVLIKKSSSKFSSFTCTNNKEILAKVYGDDYFNKYESFGVRARYAINEMEGKAENLVEAGLRKYGFIISASELINHILEEYKAVTEDTLLQGLYDIYGKTMKASSETDSILVRGLNASYTINEENSEPKVDEYYKYISPSKIVRVLVLN